MIKYNPSSFNELIINNKKRLLDFLDERFSLNDLNITICGNYNSNKSNICKLIINRFLNENSHIEKAKYYLLIIHMMILIYKPKIL